MQLTTKFRNLDTVAVLHVKRQNEIIDLVIKPKVNFDGFPDTLQTYTPLNFDYLGLFYRGVHMYKQPHIYFRKK